MDQPEPSLPDDVLAGILRRLAPRGLAASRRVCKAWRRVVDGHRLLRAELLPRALGGVFLNFLDLYFTQFLSRPATGGAVSGRLDYTAPAEHGDRVPPHPLLVVTTAMASSGSMTAWLTLPRGSGRSCPRARPCPSPPPGMHFCTDEYLVYDPTLSPDCFELVMMPRVPSKVSKEQCVEESEWPPSTLILPVFSSKTGSWEERTFRREGEAAGTVPAMVGSASVFDHQCGYCRGALDICCSYCFVLRVSLSDDNY